MVAKDGGQVRYSDIGPVESCGKTKLHWNSEHARRHFDSTENGVSDKSDDQ